MYFKTFAVDGDFVLSSDDVILRKHETTTVVVTENADIATLTFGYIDSDNAFKAFPNGVITDGAVIHHGCSCKLAVNIAGITANPVTIGYTC